MQKIIMPKGISPPNKANLIGERFERLLVTNEYGRSKNGAVLWLCICDCGNTQIAETYKLKRGSVRSCGCLRVERARKTGHKACQYKKPLLNKAENIYYHSYKCQASRRGYKFELNRNEFEYITKQNCHYCNEPPEKRRHIRRGAETISIHRNGIDRIDSDLDYTINNCVPCCKFCNSAKGELSVNEFMNKIERLYLYNLQNIISKNE